MRSIFEGIEQTEVAIRGTPVRSPLFYRDLGMMSALFTASARAARALLPTPEHRLLSPAPGLALLAVHCFEYRDTGIGPYNEVSLSVAVTCGRSGGAFRACLDAASRRRYAAYVLALPVNTEIALHGGLDFFGFPKYLADIRFSESGDTRTCSVEDPATGKPIYSFAGKKIPTRPRARDVAVFHTFPILAGKTVRTTMVVRSFERGTRVLGGGFRITPGEDPRARLLADLAPGRLLEYVHVPRAEAILFEPEPAPGAGP
ncbi:MAG: acetoacetate decarboxylase family protein [Planctomycetes bacterium]|nr:acetoacetate decarboxylase family protein [Planctomycetota bacterium]